MNCVSWGLLLAPVVTQDKPGRSREVLPSKSYIYSHSGAELSKGALCGLTLGIPAG